MPMWGGLAAAAGATAAAGFNYFGNKAEREAAARAQQQQMELLQRISAGQQDAAAAANQQVLGGSLQGQDQLLRSMGQAQGALNQGFAGAQGALGQYFGQGRQDLMGGDRAAMERLQAGLAASQGTLQGEANNSRLAALMGGGLAAGFQADPGYQFRLQQGEKAINRAAAASGGRLGSPTLQSLANFNSGLASQEFGNYANRAIGMAQSEDARRAQLMGMLAQQQYGSGVTGANYGMSTGQNLGQSAFNMGSNMSNLLTGQGGALSNLYMGGGTNLAQMMANAGQQMGANTLAGAGASVGLANNMMQQYNNPVQYAGSGYNTFANLASGLGQTGATYLSSGGGGGTWGNTGMTADQLNTLYGGNRP